MSEEKAESEFLLYTAPGGAIRVDVLLRNESIWLPQKALAALFAVGVPAVSKHLKNIFESSELQENSVVSNLETTAADGKTYQTRHYNLDAIIAVGYRVNSYEATQFRIWATATLREYMIKGFILNDERLKQGGAAFGKDYFEELLEKIREIRASERRFYQKITDIYATAADYDGRAPSTRDFFASVQNKLHFAINGQAAAEIVHERADATKPHMGLTSWKQARRQGAQVRCVRGEALPEPRLPRRTQWPCLCLPRPRGESRATRPRDQNVPVDDIPRRLSQAQ